MEQLERNKYSQRNHMTLKKGVKCRNPNLGLVTKTKVCKVACQEGGPGVTSLAPKSAKCVRE